MLTEVTVPDVASRGGVEIHMHEVCTCILEVI
jgi:hypothetical protein